MFSNKSRHLRFKGGLFKEGKNNERCSLEQSFYLVLVRLTDFKLQYQHLSATLDQKFFEKKRKRKLIKMSVSAYRGTCE